MFGDQISATGGNQPVPIILSSVIISKNNTLDTQKKVQALKINNPIMPNIRTYRRINSGHKTNEQQQQQQNPSEKHRALQQHSEGSAQEHSTHLLTRLCRVF